MKYLRSYSKYQSRACQAAPCETRGNCNGLTSLLFIMRAEKETPDVSKIARSSRRAEKLAENDTYEKTEGLYSMHQALLISVSINFL